MTQRTKHPSPFWVKLRRTQCEQMSSELPLKADIAQYGRHVSKVQKAVVLTRERSPNDSSFAPA
jgi:hypothetical protein